jgi:HD-GYP domain-containing protein (c-di-GMP phosphodiesterase class II)
MNTSYNLDTAVLNTNNPNNFSVFKEINHINKKLESLLFNIPNDGTFTESIKKLAEQLINAINQNPDGALANLMINKTGLYTIRHSINTAILSLLVAQSMKKNSRDLIAIACSCFTMNLGMIQIHDQIHEAETVSEEDKKIISQHPFKSAELLKAAGVTDFIWINYVLDHHICDAEAHNPNNKSRSKISENTKIIFIADRYCALISGRKHRKAFLPNSAMHFILTKGKQSIDPALAVCFIKELGVYPPGTLVRLENKEIAIVSFKCAKKSNPIVHALIDPDGHLFTLPEIRRTEEDCYKIREVISRDNLPIPIENIEHEHIWHHHPNCY